MRAARRPEERFRPPLVAAPGAASLSLFALHVPMFTLFSRSERLIAVPGRCLDDWRACTEAAAALPSSLLYYPLFLVLLVAFCVLFQERGVVPVRKWLVRRLMPTPALAKVPRPA